ncbi:molecular chaperone DnaJ [Algoriphagus sp. CAU 1675]|uniref:molecular chaperone DnaJ n=1 Tax=Algoriphagus sp. CAU 1675 TaxID=3032597 RepID=UPI0023DC4B05|nr:molecular chaperone DnaJ [Algoriphagus sp. CAU 1675]MDF2157909.1 molecular chaperone DnaJ [Algoriphagus sp. CAU 1675]
MKGATAAMERKDYETANSIFRNLIDSGLPLPEEMPYLFAETLFELGQYDNSSNFLKKYLELTGFNGDNYEGAKELEKRLEGPLKEIQACQLCDRNGYRFETCSTCQGKQQLEQECNYCKAKGIIGCSRCAGTGMITKKNIFNIIEYFECERCSGKGRLTCPECNGSLKELSACRTCSGSGKISSELICNHKELPHEH